MGVNQHRNWGVTFKWFDELKGTREPYVGTDKELADRKRNQERARAAKDGTAIRPAKKLGWRDVLRRKRAA
jgi:sterol desaturase/sphingolipid hydroxylase (fatty acid hydroxylase superfamily)